MLDTGWEKLNWMDDITCTLGTRQLDNGEDRIELGQTRQLTGQ